MDTEVRSDAHRPVALSSRADRPLLVPTRRNARSTTDTERRASSSSKTTEVDSMTHETYSLSSSEDGAVSFIQPTRHSCSTLVPLWEHMTFSPMKIYVIGE